MLLKLTVVFVFTVNLGVESQVPFLEPCPDVKTVSNFDLSQYLGRWYEAERYFAVFEFGGKCVTADYSLNDNGGVKILNQQISALTGIASAIEGIGNVTGKADEAKLSVRFPSLPVTFDAPYWVVDTDYDNYAVVWSCVDLRIFSARNAWILTRSRNPTLETMEKAYAALDTASISRAYFIRTDQKNCPTQY